MIKSGSAFIGIVLCLLVAACAGPKPQSEKMTLAPVGFGDLPGWASDRQSEAVPAFAKSCAVLARSGAKIVPGVGRLDWKPACAALAAVPPGDDAAVRAYFETWFQPYAVSGPDGADGLFTGYYEASLRGVLQQGGAFQVPVWQRPDDLISVDLGDFKSSLKGQKITGKVTGQKLKPYDDRAAVAGGALTGRAQPLFWTDDAVAAFFLEIQGSGRVMLPDGSVMRAGFAAQNGRDYVPIGKVMLSDGTLEKPVTMAKIRAWLAAHPDQAQGLMNRNPSVVFFRRLEGDGPVGAEGVVLTARRSLAVDAGFVPLGAPVWVALGIGGQGSEVGESSSLSLQPPASSLLIAQDTGGAIKGVVRGDMFWGYGPAAEAAAGGMQATGRAYLLLPKSQIAAR